MCGEHTNQCRACTVFAYVYRQCYEAVVLSVNRGKLFFGSAATGTVLTSLNLSLNSLTFRKIKLRVSVVCFVSCVIFHLSLSYSCLAFSLRLARSGTLPWTFRCVVTPAQCSPRLSILLLKCSRCFTVSLLCPFITLFLLLRVISRSNLPRSKFMVSQWKAREKFGDAECNRCELHVGSTTISFYVSSMDPLFLSLRVLFKQLINVYIFLNYI